MNARPSAGPAATLGRLGRLVRKELSESLRDRRTVITLVLMPLLLYPVLAMAFQQLILAGKADQEKPLYRVAFVSEEEERSIRRYWEMGWQHLIRRHGGGYDKEGKMTIPKYLQTFPELRPIIAADPAEEVRKGRVHVGIRLSPPGPFRANPTRLLFVNAEVYYREDHYYGRDAAQFVELITADANAVLVGEGLRLINVKQRGDPVQIRATPLPDESGKNTTLVPVLMPLILILMTMTGAVYPAIDLTAGERERGTLEILVAAPIPRLSVLLAKYVAVFTVATLTALVNIGTMVLTLQVTGIGPALFGQSLNLMVYLQILGLLLLLASFFSAVLLTLTSFARSFKEAQAYLIPLMLVCMTPGMLALMPGLSLKGALAVVPLINIVLLARDLLEGSPDLTMALIVVVSTLLYALGAIAVAARVFGTEAVLSSETSGWSDFFRRPTAPRSSPELGGALLCLALLFPVYFFLSTGMGRFPWFDLTGRLILSGVINVVLFACFPIVGLWMANVPMRQGFRIRGAGSLAWIVALLIGVSAWPLVQELGQWLKEMGWTTLTKEQVEQVKGLFQSVSPVVVLISLALIPAVLEELFFRGYLLGALLGDGERPMRAVVGSSIAFALFHLLVRDALALERILPSFLLGMILGTLAWRAGSVLPGILLHVLHNGIIILLGLNEKRLVEQGWLMEGQEHLPAWFLGVAGCGLMMGLLGLLVLKPSSKSRP